MVSGLAGECGASQRISGQPLYSSSSCCQGSSIATALLQERVKVRGSLHPWSFRGKIFSNPPPRRKLPVISNTVYLEVLKESDEGIIGATVKLFI